MERDPDKQAAVFDTTRWSLILKAAGHESDSRAQRALEELCKIYWFPLYAYVRHRGESPDDAEDITQSFFVRVIEKGTLSAASRERGKFRSFILASMKNFLSDENRKLHAKKRGENRIISFDSQSAESRYRAEPEDHMTPEKLFERRWALSLLGQVMKTLRDDYARAGREKLFEKIRFGITCEAAKVPYAQIAEEMNMSEGAVKVAVHRLRKDYRRQLRREIAHTVSSAEEIDEELRYVLKTLG